MCQRKPQARRGTEVKDVQRILGEMERLYKLVDGLSECVEGVNVSPLLWNIREAEPRQVWCDNPIAIREARNQLAELERRRRKSMQQQNHRAVRWTCFAVEHLNPICFDAPEMYVWDNC